MKGLRFLKEAVLSIACLGLIVPQVGLMAATPKQDTYVNGSSVVNVAMSKSGTVIGTVVDKNGTAVDGAAVTISKGDKVLVKTVTNAKGLFGARNIKPGVYKMVAGQGSRNFRVWSAKTAPPKSLAKAVIVNDSGIVRGQPVVGGVDIITGLLLTGVTVGTVFTIINNSDINDLEDELSDQDAKLQAIQDQLDIIQDAVTP